MSRKSTDQYIESNWFHMNSSERWQAFGRLLVGIPYVFVSVFFISPIILVIAVVFGIVDLIMSLLINQQFGQWNGSTLWRLNRVLSDLWDWNKHNIKWTLTGIGIGFQPLPRLRWKGARKSAGR